MKFGYFQPNQRSNANPGNQSQRESAVTMRPPSSIPTGVRLKRLRKYPNQANAIKSGAANNSPKTLQTSAPRLPRIGPPIPTHASIHALRGASLSAMNAPINGIKTGAPTFSPNFLATSRWPDSCTKRRKTNPKANRQPQNWVYTQIISSMVPPDFNKMGRNLRSGSRTNLSFAKNFAITTPTTAVGPSAFFTRLQAVSSVGALYSSVVPVWRFIVRI